MYQLILRPKLRFRMIVSVDLGVSLNMIPSTLIDGTIGYFMKYLLENMQKYGKYLDEDYRRAVRDDSVGFYVWVRRNIM